MRNLTIILSVLAIIMGGCTKEELGNNDAQNIITFNIAHPGDTKATDNAFESGDAIGVYITEYNNGNPSPLQISGNYATNIKSTYNGSQWVNSPTIYWKDGSFDVYAYYPYATPTTVDEYPFSVSLDQSTEETESQMSGYEASDFLWAKTASVSKMDAVPLTFKHKMSKLTINVLKGENFAGEIPSNLVVKVHSTITDAQIDLSTGTVTKNKYSSAKSITAKKISNNVFTAIVVPQRVDSKIPLIEIISNNVSYLIESKFIFRSGISHSINVTLDNNPDKVRIEIGGEIIDGWE